jgi:hypothetical protein
MSRNGQPSGTVTDVTAGGRSYSVVAERRASDWLARAQRADNGDPFGVECAGASEGEATTRMVLWLEWQSEHASALDSLLQAERVYHRLVAGTAFSAAADRATPTELHNDALDAVEAARIRLDDIRSRRPEQT